MRALLPKLYGAAALASLAAPALAHDGHPQAGLVAGLMHPVGGADHLVATVGLGVVAGWIAARAPHGSDPRGAAGARARARVGVAAASGLVAGALWSALAGAVPGLPAASGGLVEHAVAVGLLAVALALLSIERIGARGLAAFAALVALPHGWLHATEATGAAFLAGLALASVALFAAGSTVGAVAARLGAFGATASRWSAAAVCAGAGAWPLVPAIG
jgi:urease accessory protein